MNTSYESFGIECGKGWKGLYEPLIDLCQLRGISIMQIKEKFGGLRFYAGGPSPEKDIQLLIDAAEAYSYKVCEDCGEHGYIGWDDNDKAIPKVTTGRSETSGWIRSLCEPCRKAWDDKRNAETAEMKAKYEPSKV